MKINIKNILLKTESSFLSKCILGCLDDDILKEIIDTAEEDNDGNPIMFADIELTLNGHKLDLEGFFVDVEKQHERMIKDEAADLVSEKFEDIIDLLFDLKNLIKIEIKKRPEV